METTNDNCINLDYLRLMADNDEDMVQTMLEMLLEELPTEMEKIREMAAANNWDELTKVSHKMKSTLAFVGNEAMTAANKELERVTKYKTDLPLVGNLVRTLDDKLPSVMDALRKEQAAA